MTPRLQLAIKMLALNNLELSDMIKQEISENPIIDIDSAVFTGESKREVLSENFKNLTKDGNGESEGDAASDNALFDDGEARQDSSALKEMAQYLVNYDEQLIDLSKGGSDYKYHDKSYIIENSFYRGKTLYESIMEQVMTGNFSFQEVRLSEYIAGNLNSSGFLAISRQELADYVARNILIKTRDGENTDINKLIDSTLNKIGRLEPVPL
ncbi:MAG: hypothetical protein M1458_03210 [Deltaproteobacteria bacterium]|nr:hypothetical protein [Deltaproteobacteria bacterium]